MRFQRLAILAGLAGCATIPHPEGRDYTQGSISTFVLARTTVAQAEAVLGPPLRQSSVRGLAKATATLVAPGSVLALTTLNYDYAPLGFGPRAQHPSKSATLVFINDRLTDYDISNGIPGEVIPPIDEALLGSLHQGQTTRADAIALLGPPTGQLIHTLDAQVGRSEIDYGWAHQQDGTVELRTVKVFFDPAGTMSSYTAVNNSFPTGTRPLLTPGQPTAPPAGPGSPLPHGPRAGLEHT